jgi:hypothetical protein
MPPISHQPFLRYLSTFFSAMFLAIGLTYMVSPRAGYSLYGFTSSPTTPGDWKIMERIMVLYGAKDVFVSVAIFASTWFGTRRSAGLVLIAAGACAGADGYVVQREAGIGGWNHWGYGSTMAVLGGIMMGVVG